MMKIYLLDHRSEIFQTFTDPNQLYAFCNRSVRSMKGKTLIVTHDEKVRKYELGEESPAEIFALTIKLQNEIK
jgi:hypothetical protein